MRAIVVREFGGPEVMRVEDVPTPAIGDSQVLIRVQAIGVNPVDTYIRTGTYARKPPLPYTPHTDIGGVVESVGKGVGRFKAGDRVYAYAVAGGGAELAAVDESQVHPLPERATFQQGAAIGVPYATAYRALFIRGGARAGQTVLVHGASGGVGIACVQLASARGLRVIGTAGTDAGVTLVKAQGAEMVFDHSDPGYVDRILPATDGRGIDLIVEMLANVNLDRDLDLLAPKGRVSVVGNRGRIDIDPRKTMAKEADIVGVTLFAGTPAEFAEIHAALVAGLANGTVNPVIGKEFALEEAPRAHAAVMEAGAFGKVVLTL